MTLQRRIFNQALAAMLAGPAALSASAQAAWPAKPIRYIVGPAKFQFRPNRAKDLTSGID